MMKIPIRQSSDVKTFAFSVSASEQKDGSLECIQQSSKLGSVLMHCDILCIMLVLLNTVAICIFKLIAFRISCFCFMYLAIVVMALNISLIDLVISSQVVIACYTVGRWQVLA